MTSSNIKKPRQRNTPVARVPGSATARLEALEVGESLAEAKRLVLDKGTSAAAQEWLDAVARHWGVNVSRVKQGSSGYNFTVERVIDITRDGILLCAVVVTRTA